VNDLGTSWWIWDGQVCTGNLKAIEIDRRDAKVISDHDENQM
jgi:hypothetical protein